MVREKRTIDLQELYAFAAAVRHGGITAAAGALGLSKSSVSVQISRMERRLGARLLERNSRNVVLTREGHHMLPRVESLLAEAEQLMMEAGSAALPSGVVRVSVPPALGSAVLEHLIPALRRAHPAISLIVVAGYGMDDLKDPAFDFAIRAGQIQDEGLVARKVGRFHRIVVCAPDHSATRLTTIHSLDSQPLLTFSDRTTDVAWRLLKSGSVPQEIVLDHTAQFAIHDFELLLRLARLGEGVTMVPDFMAHEHLAAGTLTRLFPEWRSPAVDVMLAFRVGVSRVSRVAAVLEQAELALRSVLGAEER